MARVWTGRAAPARGAQPLGVRAEPLGLAERFPQGLLGLVVAALGGEGLGGGHALLPGRGGTGRGGGACGGGAGGAGRAGARAAPAAAPGTMSRWPASSTCVARATLFGPLAERPRTRSYAPLKSGRHRTR